MWSAFKAMPKLLKWICAHALLCGFFLLGSVIPHDSFSINGHHVSYAEWWSSGAGPFASLLGTVMPLTGYLLLSRSAYGRIAYLAVLSVALVLPYCYLGEFWLALFGVLVVLLISWYLFRKKSVIEYFASNPAIERSA
jgi:hypothetical protein